MDISSDLTELGRTPVKINTRYSPDTWILGTGYIITSNIVSEVWSYSIKIINLSTTFVKHHYRKLKEFVLLLTKPMSFRRFFTETSGCKVSSFLIIFFFLWVDNVILLSDKLVLVCKYLANMQIYIICFKEKDLVIYFFLIFRPLVFWLTYGN